jgi:phosphatidylglycerol lysyltransferase
MNPKVSRNNLPLQILTYGVALHGLFIVASIFAEEMVIRHGHTLRLRTANHLTFNIALAFGLSLLYVSLYLRRRKQTAWLAAIGIYAFILIVGLGHIVGQSLGGPFVFEEIYLLRSLVLPALLLLGLVYYAKEFNVRSDLRSFSFSLRFILLLLAIMMTFGVGGMMLMDKTDFHREISFPSAIHYTVDQLGLTTDALIPHTRRAKLFLDSLSTISTLAVAYGLISLFQPLRARLTNQDHDRQLTRQLLKHYGGNSEDFFKLWPHDKFYFFAEDRTAGLAYGVKSGIALVVGDPFGNEKHFDKLLDDFDEFCRLNDWVPGLVHTLPNNNELFKLHGYGLQKIGEEAVVSIEEFVTNTRRDKYFRQINNRFEKLGYSTEMLKPPHSPEIMERINAISKEWLGQPGRAERGFMMGHYSEEYMQMCNLVILRDGDGTIQAFINQIPSFDTDEANFDLLRHSKESISNSNDFLLMHFIDYLNGWGFKRINMGLCPLSGLDDSDEERTVIDSALRFLYANGDRFYSFSGLRRFKSKYKPTWESRYIAYRGGIRGFTRTLAALNRAMKIKHL